MNRMWTKLIGPRARIEINYPGHVRVECTCADIACILAALLGSHFRPIPRARVNEAEVGRPGERENRGYIGSGKRYEHTSATLKVVKEEERLSARRISLSFSVLGRAGGHFGV